MKPTRKRERDKERKTVRNEPMKMKVNMIDDSSLIHFFFFFTSREIILLLFLSFPKETFRHSNVSLRGNNNANFRSMNLMIVDEEKTAWVHCDDDSRYPELSNADIVLFSIVLKGGEGVRGMGTIVILRETLTRCNFWITQHSPCRIWGASQVHRLWGSSRRVRWEYIMIGN